MSERFQILQHPPPGSRNVLFRGDTLSFTLSLTAPAEGRAFIRTNLGHAALYHRAVIDAVEAHRPPLGTEWFDIALHRIDAERFSITLPLTETGHFEAKCFFLPDGQITPHWPDGPNTRIHVQPAHTVAANIIYNAFVRQFGPNKDGRHLPDEADAASMAQLDAKGYTVIPRSGTFRDLIAELDFITGTLGCRYVHLLPVSPTPTTYGRMGRFGSPYAALSFTGIDPALAVFDGKATPLDQFIELVDAVHARQAELLLDIAVNHTGWAASLHETHPHWLKRSEQGDIASPGAWGVVWRDLTSLDYSARDLWAYIASVFLTWCHRGVDGFRCDAGYMIPQEAWNYIIARVREQYPETIFLLEGLGGSIEITRNLLGRAGFNWAYSELFQNYTREQILAYLPEAIDISRKDGIAVHYAETHDNDRLAARSLIWAKMRTALCALCSTQGAFGFANGVEWLAREKINVHEAHPLNWGAPENQIDEIRRLNILLRSHPAFFDNVELILLTAGEANCLALQRTHRPSGKTLLIVANLDDAHPAQAQWPFQKDMDSLSLTDLLTGSNVSVATENGCQGVFLSPGQVLCLSTDPDDLRYLKQPEDISFAPERVLVQRKKAKVLEIISCYRGLRDVSDVDLDRAAEELCADPVEFCRRHNSQSDEHRVVFWQWPRDLRRTVMLPPGQCLLMKADAPFRAAILEGFEAAETVLTCDESLPSPNGRHFILFAPLKPVAESVHLTLRLSVYEKTGTRHEDAPLLFLGAIEEAFWPMRLYRSELSNDDHLFLSTNGLGGMCRADVRWGRLLSQYDALLSANLHPEVPCDRRVMFRRCRAWAVYQDYSQEIDIDNLESFLADGNTGIWEFAIPTGQGQSIGLRLSVEMIPGQNAVRLQFHRHPSGTHASKLPDDEAVRLILRPDIDDRNFHETTKAYLGPETAWPAAVTPSRQAFVFEPSPERKLTLSISTGLFVHAPEWRYMHYHEAEARRGLEAHSDLWSPGYFWVLLQGNDTVELTASVNAFDPPAPAKNRPSLSQGAFAPVAQSLQSSLSAYLVKRGTLQSVIAGYPWFLDWGRDSLIFTRGLIQTGRLAEAKAILHLFASMEDRGTLPNMISGDNTANRTTVDAPLWLICACADWAGHETSATFLDEVCGQRTLRDIVLSIADAYIAGTPNGIRMDPDSCLIYSPACFTWMDTNHPAGSPREGYCIEIAALWHRALVFLAEIDPDGPRAWQALATRVAQSIQELFVLKKGYLADCLCACDGEAACDGLPDDALRPNQLLAVTLGALRDEAICRAVLDATSTLLIPGAIRSLADEPTEYPHAILHQGVLLSNPHAPYLGRYEGDEDSCRKPGYHNGAAWTWPFPAYCEAYAKVYGEPGKNAARAWLLSSLQLLRRGCVGHLPEILDGDFPHTPRGCDAQAWGLSEWLRVWDILKADPEKSP